MLRGRLDSLKGQNTIFQESLRQKLVQQMDKTREYEESARQHLEQARKYKDLYKQEEAKARQAEENAQELREKI